jgi:hypothetical protein
MPALVLSTTLIRYDTDYTVRLECKLNKKVFAEEKLKITSYFDVNGVMLVDAFRKDLAQIYKKFAQKLKF